MRAAIYDKLLGGRNSDKDASMARCSAYADSDVPKDILQNINGTFYSERQYIFLLKFSIHLYGIFFISQKVHKLSYYFGN